MWLNVKEGPVFEGLFFFVRSLRSGRRLYKERAADIYNFTGTFSHVLPSAVLKFLKGLFVFFLKKLLHLEFFRSIMKKVKESQICFGR